MSPYEVKKTTFAVSNRSDKELEITNISASCSCTRLDIDRKIIPKGKSAHVSVAVRATPILGDREQEVFIFRDHLSEPTAHVIIKERVVAPLHVFPDRLSFGIGSHDDSALVGSLYISPGDLKQEPSDLTLDSDSNFVQVISKKVAPNGGVEFTAVLDSAQAPYGEVQGALFLKSTALPASIPVRFGGKITGKISANPSALFLRIDSSAPVATQDIVVAGLDTSDVHWEVAPSELQSAISIAPTAANKIKISATKVGVNGREQFDAVILAKFGDKILLSIPVYYDATVQ
jgi:hypothetical protein